MKKILIIIVVVVIGVLTWMFMSPIISVPEHGVVVKPTTQEPGEETGVKTNPLVQIGGQNISVEIANTDAKRELGLSGHATLSDTQGMLFAFDRVGVYPFWMKDMLFPIDIIWIDSNSKVLYIQKDAKPESFPEAFGPNKDSAYVLEVNAGFSDKNNLKIGDEVKF